MFAVTFSSESPNYASATHAAEFVQGAVPLGITQISWGTITKLWCPICSQNDLCYRNLASIVPTTHLLKITASLLITHYLITWLLFYYSFINRSLKAFVTTETELQLMAAAAIIGLSSQPKGGENRPAAKGMPMVL